MLATRLIRTETDIAAGLAELLRVDPSFLTVVERAGPIPLRQSTSDYTGLAGIIVAQMISKAAADSIWRRIEAISGEVSAEAVLAMSAETLRGAGLSNAKETTLRRIAEAVATGGLDLAGLGDMPPSEAMQTLTAIKGVGPWTAEVYLLFCAGHSDIFPVGDVALQNAAAHAFKLDSRPTGKSFSQLAERWSPWRSLAARALWAYYSTEMRREATPVAG